MNQRGGQGGAVDPNDRTACEATALRILNGAAQSQSAMRRRLVRHGFSEDSAKDVTTKLVREGWINDSQLAVSIASRRSRSGYGRRRIAADLSAHGIRNDVLVVEALDSVDAASELESAKMAAERLRRRFPEGRLEKGEMQKLAAALQRRGFGFDVIRSALREVDSLDQQEVNSGRDQ